MWQFPNETLTLNEGDCEDQAILLCAMINCYSGGHYAVHCIGFDASNGGHIAVQLPVSGNKISILDTAGDYFTHNSFGTLTSKDVSEEINNWLTYWADDAGSDIYIDMIFSNTVDQKFKTTNEYITWMYDTYN